MNVAGILLAAGAGTRFRAAGGGSKLLADVGGRPLVERPLSALRAAGLSEVVVVLGADAGELQAGADLTGARVLVHSEWAEGMASSLVAALHTLGDDCEAAVVVLGDGPGLESEAVSRVAARIAVGDAQLVSARYSGGRAHPVAIARGLWPRLPRRGEDGARALGVAPVEVDCTDLTAPGDADTPDELV